MWVEKYLTLYARSIGTVGVKIKLNSFQNSVHKINFKSLKVAHIVPTERKTLNAFLLSYPYIVPNGTNYWIKYLIYTPPQSPFSIFVYTAFVALRAG